MFDPYAHVELVESVELFFLIGRRLPNYLFAHVESIEHFSSIGKRLPN